MHPYSCAEGRGAANVVYVLLSVAAIASAYGLSSSLDAAMDTAWYIEWPSVLGLFALYHKAFDRWLWRIKPIRRALRLPDIEGSYSGTAKSSDPQHPEVSVTVKIWQSWTTLSVELTAPNSRSTSESATLCMRNQQTWELTYTYMNRPRNDAVDSMSIHQGTTMMTFEQGSSEIEGEYYTGRGRQTHGVLKLRRTKNSGSW